METKRRHIRELFLVGFIIVLYLYMRLFNTKFAAEEQEDGTCKIGVEYSTAWILVYPSEYDGMRVSRIDNDNFSKNCSDVRFVYIEDGIEVISSDSFAGSDLLGVKFPNTLRNIKFGAFWCCENLCYPCFPESVGTDAYIDEFAFSRTGLRRLELPEGITTVSEYAFCGCENLKYVVLPESLVELENNAFEECIKLENIYQKNLSSGEER